MSLMATKPNGTQRELIPTGLHEAILIWIVDLGQQDTPWGYKQQVMFTFELCKQLIKIEGEGFKPKVISTRPLTPFITPESNLGKLLMGWFGKLPDEVLDLRKLVGQHCMVNVVHNDGNDGNTYANIGSIAPATKECKKIEQFHDSIVFEFGKDQLPEILPEWIRNKVMQSKDWNEQGQQNEGPERDEPPF